MRPRWLLLSLGLNLVLAAAWFYALARQKPNRSGPDSGLVETSPPPFIIKTNVVVRRQYFTWQEIESTDYRTFIANLRSIGCPDPTIRDIIVAEVNSLYDRKRATDIVVPEQEWWRSDPNPEANKAAFAQFESLESERRALLTELLGPNWETPNHTEMAAFNLRLDGLVLGTLPQKTKQTLRDIEARAVRRRQAYLEIQQKSGKPTDPALMARLEQQTRNELAQTLNPEQLEEYLLRYSPVSQSLRSELHGLEITPEEFRNIFRSRDGIEQQLQAFPNGGDSTGLNRRKELENQRDLAVKEALGPERYQMFKYSQDPIFRAAKTAAEKIGAPPEAVLPVYEINQAVELERQRIRDDSVLTLEQRAAALAHMFTQQQESLRKVLGEKAYELYRGTGSTNRER
jgi:hypothetical protein